MGYSDPEYQKKYYLEHKQEYIDRQKKRRQEPGYKEKNAAYQQERKDKNPEAEKARRRGYRIKSVYGITIEEWNTMYEAQGGKCAICGEVFTGGDSSVHTDHHHTTHKVRGLLCHNCNKGLGNFRDNPQFLRNAASFVEENE